MKRPTVHVVSFMRLDYRIRDPLHFAAAFAEAGWRVESIELDGSGNHFRRFESHGINRLQLPFGWTNMPYILRPIRRIMRYIYFLVCAILLRMRYRAGDIIIANDGWSLLLVNLAVPLERVIYYEVEIPNHITSATPLFEQYLRRFLITNVRRCAMLVSVERHRLRFLSKLYKNHRTMVVLNATRRADIRDEMQAERPVGDKPRLIYAGRLWGYTLSPLLLEFVARYHGHYEIDIFGEPVEDCREAYERVRELPGVTCHGFAPRAILEDALLRANAAFVFWDPNDRSNFGLKYCSPHKFFESVANGIPVVCSPNPSLRERLSEYEVGEILESLTPEGIQDALSRLFRPGAYQHYREECRRAIEGDWNYETQVKPLIERIRQMSNFAEPTDSHATPTPTTARPQAS